VLNPEVLEAPIAMDADVAMEQGCEGSKRPERVFELI
jgi:hypothetical protein